MPSRWSPRAASRLHTAQAALKAAGPPIDPGLRWATLTDWRGMKAHAGWDRNPHDDGLVQILARAVDHQALDQALAWPLMAVPEVYHRPLPAGQRRLLHFTARLKLTDLPRLAQEHPALRWEIAAPLRDAERLARGSHYSRFGPDRPPDDFHRSNRVAAPVQAVEGDDHPAIGGLVLALIDFGCPFLHEQFRTPAGTRVAAVWDQGGSLPDAHTPGRLQGWPWRLPRGFAHGRQLGPRTLAAIDEAVWQPPPGAPVLDEFDVYAGIDHLIDHDDPRRRIWHATHGGALLDLAAGRLDPLTQRPDAASDAALVVVQLPSMTAADSAGASLGAQLLDGLRYVLDVCAPDAKLVVNISYGSHAGPHNGRSLIETAMTELLESRPKDFSIVLAAGNARQSRCHVQRSVRRRRTALLRCQLAAGDTTDTFVEVWYAPPPARTGRHLEARVRPPGRVWSDWQAPGQGNEMRELASHDEVVAMLHHEAADPQGAGLGLILLAVGPTAQPDDVACPLADAGLWEIEVRLVERGPGAEPEPVQLHAWIERDDPGQNPGAGPSYFVDQDADDDTETLSSLATGPHAVVAGGFCLASGRPVPYSSIGSRHGPMVLAACERDSTTPGLLVAATRSGERVLMNGTSVAAPVLARRLLNVLARRSVPRRGWPAVLKALARSDPFVKPLPG